MKPIVLDLKSGRAVISALRTGEISVMLDCGRGTMGVLANKLEACELIAALTAAIRNGG